MDVKSWIKNNWEYLTLYILSSSFFIYQHFVDHELWDFYVYLMNGKFWFHHGFYFEIYRAPITPLIMGLLGGNLFAEYAYLILVSSLFAIVTYYLAKELKINETIFYALLLNGFLLFEALANGTELLALVFLEAGIFFVLKEDIKSGFFLALSFLTRYTMGPYSIIIFFQKNWKKTVIAISILILTILPWLIYNKIAFGNYFASIADSYALNVAFRKANFQMPNPMDLLIAGNILWVLLAVGIYQRKIKLKRETLIFGSVLLIAIINYVITPFKITRYLFPIILPLAYFGSVTLKNKKAAYVIFAIMLIGVFLIQPRVTDYYKYPVEKIHELNLSNCYIESNVWPLLDYYGLPTSPSVYPNLVQHEINSGKILILYNTKVTSNESVIYNNGNYVILGHKNCTKRETPVVYSYLKQLNYNNKILGKRDNYTYCDVFLPKICNLVNDIQ